MHVPRNSDSDIINLEKLGPYNDTNQAEAKPGKILDTVIIDFSSQKSIKKLGMNNCMKC